MDRRTQVVFLYLILAQALHSAEECLTKLYDFFAPSHFIASLFSHHIVLGFLIANANLVAFGLRCWAFPVRAAWPSARRLM